MNDRYLYRAKRTDSGEWVEGNLIEDGVTGKVYIHAKGNSVNESDRIGEDGYLQFVAFEVYQSTICQCTGLKDKNGNLIWENDIVTVHGYGELCLIEWGEDTARWHMTQYGSYVYDFDNYWSYEVEVISNIFDNPELLEGEVIR